MPQVIAVAKSQVGYRESYAEGGWSNFTRYAAEVPGMAWADGESWCAVFTSWVAMRAGVGSLFPRTASCDTAITWFTNAGRWSWFPAIGAQAFYGTSGQEHTGIVYAYDSTYIWTVEGNTSDTGSSEGDGVYLRRRKRADAAVYGYGLPAYAEGVITADPALKGKSGFTYAVSSAGPGAVELKPGGLMTTNLVADALSVNGAATVGRVLVQQDSSTVALEVVAASASGPSIFQVKDASGNVAFEVTAAGRVTVRNTASAPATNPVGGGILYAEAGALKWRGPNGTVTVIAPA